MTTVETLRAARELIADPEHWCQGVAARSRKGREVKPTSRAAIAWCAIGACRRIAAGRDFDGAFLALDRVAAGAGASGVSTLNDHRTHAEVLAMFDRAIENEEGKA